MAAIERENNRLKEKLIYCINRLSDEEKYFIHLRFVNEMKFKDISGLLGITEEAAKNAVNAF